VKRVGAALLWTAVVGASLALLPGLDEPARAAAEGTPDFDEGPDRGFYLGLAAIGTSYTINLDDRATPMVEGFEFDDLGVGTEVFCGLMFEPGFRLEFGASVTVHDAAPGDAKLALTGARVTGYLPLIAGRRVEPSLLAGMGAAGVAFASDEFEDRFYVSFRGDMGAGLRLRLTRHQFIQISFLYSIHDVEREFIDLTDERDPDMRHVGGEAWTRSLGIGWGWDF